MNNINFRTFDLNLLKVLDALLKEGSTVGAARRLNLTQSAVSAALRRLRTAVGDELFVRRGAKLEPTDYARNLEIPLRDAMAELKEIFEGNSFFPETSKAIIRISGPDFFSDMLLPELAEFTNRHAPGMQLQMLDLVPDDHFITLVKYESDLLIMPQAKLPDWAVSKTIFKSEFATIVRAGHPALQSLDHTGRLSLDVFCEIPQILYSPSGNWESFTDKELSSRGRQRRVLITLPKFSSVVQTVSRTDYVSTVPRSFAEHAATYTNIVLLPPTVDLDPHPMTMVWSKRSSNNAAHRWIRQHIARLVRKYDADHVTIEQSYG